MTPTDRPNVLFFFTDDQRFDTIAALGNPEVKTPNIDKLVARGTVFTHAHIPSGTSGAVCMPSRAMLHTGRTLYHIKDAGQTIAEDHVLLGETFQRHGYRTFGTGKWHNGTRAYARSFTDGDEIFFGGMEDHWNVPANRFDPTGEYSSTIQKCMNAFYSNREQTYSADHVSPGKHSSELFCDAAIRFLEKGGGDDPWFAYVSFMAPHDPRVMPEKFRQMYDPEKIELPPNFLPGNPFLQNYLGTMRDEVLAEFPRDPAEIRRHIAEYYAIISHLDHELGRVMDKLEETGQTENTIIVFAGDNGLAVGQHGLMGKQSCYEHSNRVPLIFAGPGIPVGHRTDAYAYLLDIYPTLCELVGMEVPDSVEGISLVDAMHDDTVRVRDHIFYGYTDSQRAIKDRRYKLFEFATDKERATLLFDLEEDPWEMNNLADRPEHQERLEELRRALRHFAEDWNDAASPWGETFWARM